MRYNITWGDDMINEQIKKLRKQMKLTQTQLAEKLNVSQSTVASWENGTRRPDLDLLPVIADFFGVSVNDIYGRESQQADNIDDEVMAIRDRLRNDPSYRLLFIAAGKASQDHLKAATAMLKALEGTEPDDNNE